MGLETWSGARFWERVEAASIRLATKALTASINDKLLGKFANQNDLTTALSTLSAAQKRGSIGWTDTVGHLFFDGSQLRRLGGDMWLQSSFGGFTPQASGLLRIEFPVKFGEGSTPRVWAVHSTSDRGAPVLSIQPYHADGYINASQAHFLVKNDGAVYANYLEMMWFAHGPRPALV